MVRLFRVLLPDLRIGSGKLLFPAESFLPDTTFIMAPGQTGSSAYTLLCEVGKSISGRTVSAVFVKMVVSVATGAGLVGKYWLLF